MVTERREAKYGKDWDKPTGTTEDKTTGKAVNTLTAARARAKQPQAEPRDTPETREAYINKVEFSGRLGRDPEHHFTPSKREVIKSSLAVFNPGNDEYPTMWFDLTMWVNEEDSERGPSNIGMVELFLNLEKGNKVVARGQLTFHSFVDKQGDTHSVYGIKLTDIG